MEYHSIRQLEELCKTEQKPVWKIVLKAEQTETDETEKQIFERMRQMYHEMKAADEGYAAELRSASGMAGGDGEKMHRFNVTGKNLCSGYMALAMEKALKMGESNACMKRIVAAPTAGSCGVIPAVLISYEEVVAESEESGDDPAEDRMVQALFTAAGIGKVIAENASIAGASGGCSYVTAAVRYHRFASLHTILNKATGFCVFCLPYMLVQDFALRYCEITCVIAGLASTEEFLIHLLSKEYEPGRKFIWKR